MKEDLEPYVRFALTGISHAKANIERIDTDQLESVQALLKDADSDLRKWAAKNKIEIRKGMKT